MSIKEFMALARRLQADVSEEAVSNLPNGSFLGIHSTDEGKTFVRLHLQTIWITPYRRKYRTTKTKNGKSRRGDEIVISNMPLPKRLKFKRR